MLPSFFGAPFEKPLFYQQRSLPNTAHSNEWTNFQIQICRKDTKYMVIQENAVRAKCFALYLEMEEIGFMAKYTDL